MNMTKVITPLDPAPPSIELSKRRKGRPYRQRTPPLFVSGISSHCALLSSHVVMTIRSPAATCPRSGSKGHRVERNGSNGGAVADPRGDLVGYIAGRLPRRGCRRQHD